MFVGGEDATDPPLVTVVKGYPTTVAVVLTMVGGEVSLHPEYPLASVLIR